MSWWLWVLVGILMLAMFGLGCIFARATLKRRGEDRMLPDPHANALLGVFFTIVAIAVAADTIHLQVQYTRDTRGRVMCNSRAVDAAAKVAAGRMEVDKAAAAFDVALAEYLAEHQDKFVTADDPVYIAVQNAVRAVATERMRMLQVYADNPAVTC